MFSSYIFTVLSTIGFSIYDLGLRFIIYHLHFRLIFMVLGLKYSALDLSV